VATGEATPTPSAKAVFEARISRLGTRERLVARAAAVVGEVFWDRALKVMLAGTATDVDEALAVLSHEELICRRDVSRVAGAAEYVFRHALLRDAAEAACSAEALRGMHAVTASWLAEVGSSDHAAIAHHAEAGGLQTLAGQALTRAGQAAARAYDSASAIRLLERALELMPPSDAEQRFDIHAELEALYRDVAQADDRKRHLIQMQRLALGNGERTTTAMLREGWQSYDSLAHGQAERIARRTIALVDESQSAAVAAEARLLLSTALRESGDHDRALEELAHGERLAAGVNTSLLGEILRARGVLLRRLGRMDDAFSTYHHALRLYESAGAHGAVARVLNALGYALYVDWRIHEAYLTFQRALAMLRRIGFRRGEAGIVNNLANVRIAVGDWAGAKPLLDEAIDLHRRHDAYAFRDTLHLRARVALMLGDLAEASSWLAEAAGIAGTRYDVAHGQLVTGWLHLRQDEPTDAIDAFATAAETASSAHTFSFAKVALAERGRARLLLGDSKGAIRDAQDSLAMMTASGASFEWAPETLDAILAVLGAGAHDQLPSVVRVAKQWLTATTDKIGDDQLRGLFVLRPEVRRIREAAT
jgi:tetratricopeptide (TPR) repeat protein